MINRRTFLASTVASAAVLGAGPLAAAPAAETTLADGDAAVFPYSVASGDPMPDRVVLWTTITPPPDGGLVELRWTVATDPELSTVVAEGTTHARAERGWCAKVDAVGLPADTVLYYVFQTATGGRSDVGRTKTTGGVSLLRFVATTCTNPGEGGNMYHTFARLAEMDALDFVLHLGDYVYEFGGHLYEPDGTPHDPATGNHGASAWSVHDYRERHADWRRREYFGGRPHIDAHRLHPWVVLWDDGDVWNGVTAAPFTAADGTVAGVTGDHGDHYAVDPDTRKANAIRAHHEWVPCRDAFGGLWGESEPGATPAVGSLQRVVPMGPLADLVCIDALLERRGRYLGIDVPPFTIAEDEVDNPDRRMMSDAQLDWMLDALAGPDRGPGRWRLLANQVMLGHWGSPGLPSLPAAVRQFFGIRDQGNQAYTSSWNGYPVSRARVMEGLAARGSTNLLAYAGDAHFSFVQHLTADPMDPTLYDPVTGRGAVGAEFLTPSASSVAFADMLGYPPRTGSRAIEAATVAANPHQHYAELDSTGFVLTTLSPERAVVEYWMNVDPKDGDNHAIRRDAAFVINDGDPRIVPYLVPDLIDPDAPPPDVAAELGRQPELFT